MFTGQKRDTTTGIAPGGALAISPGAAQAYHPFPGFTAETYPLGSLVYFLLPTFARASTCRGSGLVSWFLLAVSWVPSLGVMGTSCSAVTGTPCLQLQSVLLVSWDLGHPREGSRVPPPSSCLSLCNPLIPQDPMNPTFLLSRTIFKAFGLSLLYTQISLGS